MDFIRILEEKSSYHEYKAIKIIQTEAHRLFKTKKDSMNNETISGSLYMCYWNTRVRAVKYGGREKYFKK